LPPIRVARCLAESNRPDAGRIGNPALPGGAESSRLVFEFKSGASAQQKSSARNARPSRRWRVRTAVEKPPEAAAAPPSPNPQSPARPADTTAAAEAVSPEPQAASQAVSAAGRPLERAPSPFLLKQLLRQRWFGRPRGLCGFGDGRRSGGLGRLLHPSALAIFCSASRFRALDLLLRATLLIELEHEAR